MASFILSLDHGKKAGETEKRKGRDGEKETFAPANLLRRYVYKYLASTVQAANILNLIKKTFESNQEKIFFFFCSD